MKIKRGIIKKTLKKTDENMAKGREKNPQAERFFILCVFGIHFGVARQKSSRLRRAFPVTEA